MAAGVCVAGWRARHLIGVIYDSTPSTVRSSASPMLTSPAVCAICRLLPQQKLSAADQQPVWQRGALHCWRPPLPSAAQAPELRAAPCLRIFIM